MRLVFTPEGRAAIINAQNTGTNAVLVTQIGVTEQAFVPDPEGGYLTLPGERKRLTTFGGSAVAGDVIHVSIRDDSTDNYSLRGIGLYLDTGTLLCVSSQPEVILEKSPQAMMLLAADMMLSDIDASAITFGSTEFLNPPATTEVQGVVELATNLEVAEGKDDKRAVTSAALLYALNARLGNGAPTALAKKLIATATEAVFRELLGIKGAALLDTGHGNGLDADTLDGKHGDFYLDWANLTNRPGTYFMPGQVVLMANINTPAGLLPCDGREVSRTQYPALFNAIGTRYGGGNGSSTFNLPNIVADTVPVHTDDVAKVGQATTGSVIAHAHVGESAAAGDHGHTASSGDAGGHSHTASSGDGGSHTHTASTGAAGAHGHGASAAAVADHTHSSWTDQVGAHSHTGSTSAAGAHAHNTSPWLVNDPYKSNLGYNIRYSGNANGSPLSSGYEIATSSAGDHAHSLTTAGAGAHAHSVVVSGAGGHSHTISVANAADHTHSVSVVAGGGHNHTVSVAAGGVHSHSVSVASAGSHTHAITVRSTGGTANLPAGIRMRYFIAY